MLSGRVLDARPSSQPSWSACLSGGTSGVSRLMPGAGQEWLLQCAAAVCGARRTVSGGVTLPRICPCIPTSSPTPRTPTRCLPSRCYADGQYEQAVGVALEARRLDQLERAIVQSSALERTLQYALTVSQQLVVSREFRQQVCVCVLWYYMVGGWECEGLLGACCCVKRMVRYA